MAAPTTIYEALAAPFHEELGKTLTRWQYVETGLFVLAHGLMGTQYVVSSVVFFQITSARSKLGLVDQLASQIVPQRAYQAVWKDIKTTIGSYVTFRDGLAHFELSYLPDASMMVQANASVILSPHHLNVVANRNATVPSVDYDGLIEAGRLFFDGAKRLIHFGAEHVPHWRQQVKLLPPRIQQAILAIRNTALPEERLPQRGGPQG